MTSDDLGDFTSAPIVRPQVCLRWPLMTSNYL
ncbi:hypothetical protein Ctob_014740 [Chrysochromulina tobinii]|uniref:Uncharacterized protein n=1 Tax=Chrysochromulina tobinii TaxID=1460289 RepID=A0A0M0K470_9EUKA|nr:hypothetical protein Ctob_014740 [Chrysochromulina tobinii]|eukprot:KOO33666.1 hypothetical protein Ctob_014740 [Chrysochromulina sp. CCMP291]